MAAPEWMLRARRELKKLTEASQDKIRKEFQKLRKAEIRQREKWIRLEKSVAALLMERDS